VWVSRSGLEAGRAPFSLGGYVRRYSGTADLLALKRLMPDQWAERIIEAMENHDGRVPAAAESLGVSKRVMYRWLGEKRFRSLWGPLLERGTRDDNDGDA
jgi:hypothetical protein